MNTINITNPQEESKEFELGSLYIYDGEYYIIAANPEVEGQRLAICLNDGGYYRSPSAEDGFKFVGRNVKIDITLNRN